MRWELVSLLLFTVIPWSYAQKPFIRFKGLEGDVAAAHQRINAAVMDGDGFMWFALPGGLMRFDGYRTNTYVHDPDDPSSPAMGSAKTVFCDRRGTLWVGMNSRGLCRYDPVDDGFRRYDLSSGVNGALNQVSALAEDADGHLVVATRGGVVIFDPQTERGIAVYDLGMDRLTATVLHQRADGEVWIGHGARIYRQPHCKRAPELVPFQGVKGQIKQLYTDSRGLLWVVGSAGAWAFAGDDMAPRYTYRDATFPGFPDELNGVGEDALGRMWFATYLQGLVVLPDPAARRIYTYTQEVEDPWGVGSRNIWHIYTDPRGTMWFSTDQGPRMLPGINSRIVQYLAMKDHPEALSDSHVWCFFEDARGRIWIGTDKGLNLWDEAQGRFTAYLPAPDNPEDVPANRVRAMAQDLDGGMWVGGREAVFRFDPDRGFYKTYRSDSLRKLGSMRTILTDRRGGVWLGSFHGGLLTYNREKDLIQPFQSVEGLYFDRVRHLIEDRSGRIWVASEDGLGMVMPDTGSAWFKRHREGRPLIVMSLLEAENGTLWAACGEYLAYLEPGMSPDAGFLDPIDKTRGLDALVIYGILEQEARYIWASTDKGLFRYDPRSDEVRHYRRYHGLQGDDFASGAFLKDNRGRLFFGGSAGFNVVDPGLLDQISTPEAPVLSDLMLQYQPIRPGTDPVLPHAMHHATRLSLDYRRKMVSVGFTALDFSAPEHNRYAYRLKGFDEDWVTAAPRVRQAVYTNLDAGRYRFQVKAWDTLGRPYPRLAEMELVVAAAPWSTPLAWVGYGLLALILGFWVVRARTEKLRKERLHWQALEEKNKEILRAQSKLVMQEKMASVGLLTAGIAHEIKNPTTFTRISAQNLGEDLEEFREWLTELAGDDAGPEFVDILHRRMAPLHEHVDLIKEGSARIVALAQNLQTFSRSDNATREVALTEGIRSTLNLVRAKFRDQIHFRMCFEDELRTWCRPGQMNQVFMNLIVNACQELRAKYIDTGKKGTLSIHTRREEDCGILLFKDTGRGMSEEIMSQIFEPFFTTKASSQGTGLGLAITSRIVREHGGRIEVESQVGKGTTFTLHLPADGRGADRKHDTIPGYKLD